MPSECCGTHYADLLCDAPKPRLISYIIAMKAPSDLAKNILLRIDREERRRFLVKTVAFGAVLAGSLAAVVMSTMNMAADLARSGFLSFASLLFSDFSAAMASFSDFIFSLAASFPVFSAVLLLSGIFVAIWSAAGFIDEVMLTRRHTFHLQS